MNKIYITIAVLVLAGVAWFAFPMGEKAEIPAPQGKIDVEVACRSALAYTTFTDAASAEVFVQECKDGKHPDVIQRYIESLGLDGATV